MEMDVEQEARVWSRVMGTEEAAEVLTAEEVLTLLRKEEQSACTFRYLSRVCPAGRRILLKLAEEERCHADRLRAVYFLMTGERVCPCGQKKPCITCLRETLRQLYRKKLETHRHYETLVPAAGEYAPVLDAIARDEKRHSRSLLCLLEKVL